MGGRISRSKQGARKGDADLRHMVRTYYSTMLKAEQPYYAQLPDEQQAWLKHIRNIGGVAVFCRGGAQYKAVVERCFNEAIEPDDRKWQQR